MENIPIQYKDLLEIAKLPKNNPLNFDFEHYDLTPIDHDYAGQFQKKANFVFQSLGMPFGFLMVVGKPDSADKIYEAFRKDPKYLGGGTGSGFKNRAPAFMDDLHPLAKQIGAVNVVAKVNGRLIGYNTDGIGFVRGLDELFNTNADRLMVQGGNFSSLKFLILGAGGTADAIALTLASRGAHLTILNRTVDKALKLAEKVNAVNGKVATGGSEDLITQEAPLADVIINASTKGAEGVFKDYSSFATATEGKLADNLAESAKIISLLKPGVVVCDVNLRSDESPTLRQAREAGILTQDGTAMNLYQAVEAMWIIHKEDFLRLNVSKEDLAKLIAQAS